MMPDPHLRDPDCKIFGQVGNLAGRVRKSRGCPGIIRSVDEAGTGQMRDLTLDHPSPGILCWGEAPTQRPRTQQELARGGQSRKWPGEG